MSPDTQFVLQQILLQMRFLCETVVVFANCFPGKDSNKNSNDVSMNNVATKSALQRDYGNQSKSCEAPRAISLFNCLFSDVQPIEKVVISIHNHLLAPAVPDLQPNLTNLVPACSNSHVQIQSDHIFNVAAKELQRLHDKTCLNSRAVQSTQDLEVASHTAPVCHECCATETLCDKPVSGEAVIHSLCETTSAIAKQIISGCRLDENTSCPNLFSACSFQESSRESSSLGNLTCGASLRSETPFEPNTNLFLPPQF